MKRAGKKQIVFPLVILCILALVACAVRTPVSKVVDEIEKRDLDVKKSYKIGEEITANTGSFMIWFSKEDFKGELVLLR